MQNITIRSKLTNTVIYSAHHPTPAHALETALAQGINLAHSNLSGLNLAHANLDGANFTGCNLDYCNLTGANLSETNFSNATVRHADLSLATLCDATLLNTDFFNSSFFGTLITGARLHLCTFTCPSSLTLPFSDASLGRNHYTTHPFTSAPIVITGLPKRIVFLDDTVLIGHTAHPRLDFSNPFEGLFKKTV